MTKYAHINSQNILQGWYESEIHTTIPTPNIKVTDEQWQSAIDNNNNKINADGSSEWVDTRTAEQISEEETARQTKEDLKASAKTKLMAGDPLTEEEADVMIGG